MMDTILTITISDKRRRVIVGRMLATVVVPLFLVACTNTANQFSSYENTNRPITNSVSHSSNNSGNQSVAVISPRLDSSFLALANEMAGDGDYHAAIPLYRRAAQWNPRSAAPLIGLGNSLRAVGQYQNAQQAYQSALSWDKKNAEALRGLGKSYIAQNRPTMAVPILQDAVAANSRDVDAINSLAMALKLQGNSAAATAVYKDGLNIDPNNLKLLTNYGLSLALQSRYDQAIDVLKKAAQHKDAGASHRQNLAMAYALGGDEIMAARLLSIDNGPDLANENLSYFRVLASLSSDDRFDSVIRQSIKPKTDGNKRANEVYDDHSRVKNVTVARLTEELPEPIAMAKPLAAIAKEENIPPLLGPQGWALQIAAYRKKSELMPGWKKLKKKYFDIIGTLEPRRSEVDLGEAKEHGAPHGFYYRLNAGPLTSLEEAREACKKIREQGTDCWVRIPEVSEGSVAEKDVKKAEEFRRKVYPKSLKKKRDSGV